MKRDDNDLEKEIDRVFQRARGSYFETSPYMKTRVLARVDGVNGRGKLPWLSFTMGSFATAAVAVVIFFAVSSRPNFNASVAQPLFVKVEVRELSKFEVARVEIELPDGVYFISKSHPELNTAKSMGLVWTRDFEKKALPFVIEGKNAGLKVVRIHFFDNNNREVYTRELKIKFMNKG